MKYQTQAEVDAAIASLMEKAFTCEERRDRCLFESRTYWRWHDRAMRHHYAAEALMPGGSFWESRKNCGIG